MPEISKIQQQILDDISRLQASINKIEVLLTGNGDPSKGVIVRLDRLEVSKENNKWTLRACLVASFGALAGFISHIFSWK